MVRGIRGATRANENSKEAIFAATTELLQAILARNEIDSEEIASIFLTTTPDLTADFPAYAVRGNGFRDVPVLCASEIAVPGAMTRVVRLLIHVNTNRRQNEIKHVYLGDTAKLRPDLSGEEQQ
jgi:chorismate mutase